jgi:hypothetical protein
MWSYALRSGLFLMTPWILSVTDQREAWVDYLAMTASTGGGSR